MGYTHSWIRPRGLERGRFAAAARDCQRICEASGVVLRGIEGEQKPTFENFIVAFNGECEAFVIQCVCGERGPERLSPTRPGMHRGYCKTEHLPYDVCVQACLVAFQHHFDTDFVVSSDGADSEWDAARQLCQRSVGYGAEFMLDKE